jgi:hypothetical protein
MHPWLQVHKRNTLTGQFSFYGSMKSVIDRYTKAKEELPAGLDATSQTKVCFVKMMHVTYWSD